jgi:hypothetical protein
MLLLEVNQYELAEIKDILFKVKIGSGGMKVGELQLSVDNILSKCGLELLYRQISENRYKAKKIASEKLGSLLQGNRR